MTPENTEKLYQAFPRLYRGQNKSLQESSMRWGFQCDNGWFDLIWNLSQAIEELARQEGLEPQSDDWPEATQVKEKLGTLRFHLKNHNDSIHALIDQAREDSEKICEVCGAPSQQVDNAWHWVKSLCSKHAEEYLLKTAPSIANKTPAGQGVEDREKATLQIGIFFLIDDVVLRDSLPIEQGQQYGHNIEHGAHYEYWLNLAPTTAAESTFKAHGYDYYPRGRVVFNSQQRRAKLYIDRCIRGAARATIRQEFALPKDTLIDYDTHYQCHRCNPTYLDDFDENDE